MHISTRVLGAQHPNTSQNIQQVSKAKDKNVHEPITFGVQETYHTRTEQETGSSTF